MTDQPTFEHELRRRALVEDAAFAYEDEDGIEFADSFCGFNVPEFAHLAAKVHLDRTNPIAATAVVRKDAVTEITPPDVEVLLAAFNRPEEDQ